MNTPHHKRIPTPHQVSRIQAIVASHFGYSLSELLRTGREEPRVSRRQIAMHLARELTESSFPVLRDAFLMKGHKTIRHGCAAIADRAETDPKFAAQLASLRQTCEAALNN